MYLAYTLIHTGCLRQDGSYSDTGKIICGGRPFKAQDTNLSIPVFGLVEREKNVNALRQPSCFLRGKLETIYNYLNSPRRCYEY